MNLPQAMNWPQASKIVGWDKRSVSYPTMTEVDRAITNKNVVALLEWYRFLPSPTDGNQIEIINKIFEETVKLRDELS